MDNQCPAHTAAITFLQKHGQDALLGCPGLLKLSFCVMLIHGNTLHVGSGLQLAWVMSLCCQICMQIPLAIMVLLDPAVNHDTIYGHTRMSTLMCLISSGYFLYDLVVVLLRFNQEGGAFLVHASCCLFVYTYAVYSFYLHFFGECSNGVVLQWVLNQLLTATCTM